MDPLWHIELLGWLRARHVDRVVDRFRTQKAGVLLAYLALSPERSHPRELLADLLWPEDDADTARRKLRITLSPLRAQLEPPGVPPGKVLLATRSTLQLNPAVVATDVRQFEAALQSAAQAPDGPEQARQLAAAVELYRGELLPGCFEEWVFLERERLAEAHRQALRQLVHHLEQAGELAQALACARQLVTAAPLWEAAHQDLMRLLAAAGEPEAALRQYLELERLLERDLEAEPEPPSRELAQQIRRGPRAAPPPVDGRIPPASPAPTGDEAVHPSVAAAATAPATESQRAAADSSRPAPLPLPLTRFFGRIHELQQLRVLLGEEGRRLVTLTGPGGSGKTRLALELARFLRSTGSGAVAFVPLVDLADPRWILDRVMSSLRLPRAPGADPLELVVDFLSRQPTLLVLDNFEQLALEGAPLLELLLHRVETLTLLVTSRQRLDLPGERELPIVPLPTPVGADTPERLAQYDSVRLFVDRAQAARPEFQLTLRNAAAVATLCERLEGLPLALELAAARAGMLTAAQMLMRLEERFAFLVSRRGQPDPRHQSLWATLEWSYQLLSPALQQFFARLSVFRGGWTPEAAAAVCGEPAALHNLTQLRGASLVVIEEAGDELRYRMLETAREFAGEKLRCGDERAVVHRRHLGFFAALAEEAGRGVCGPEQSVWVERLQRESDNFRAALDWCDVEPSSQAAGLRLAAGLWPFWYLGGGMEGGAGAAQQGPVLGGSGRTKRGSRSGADRGGGIGLCSRGHGAGRGTERGEPDTLPSSGR